MDTSKDEKSSQKPDRNFKMELAPFICTRCLKENRKLMTGHADILAIIAHIKIDKTQKNS